MNKKIKLGGLTWWRYNYGSILQAFALQEKLNSYSHIDYEIICQYGKKVTSKSNLIDKLKRYGVFVTLKKIIWKFGLKKLRDRNRRIQFFMDSYLKVSKQEFKEDDMSVANKYYDGFICGSDQIWNPKLVPVNSVYWLNFAEKDKLKIAYAPSIGVDELTNIEKEIIKKNLRDFTAVSSREERGTELINGLFDTPKCVTVLDPTMLVGRELWDSISNKRLCDKKYVFAYILRGNKEQRKVVEQFARAKGLFLVTMPFLDAEKIEIYDFTYGDVRIWDADPADFVSAIRYADYVFTDSFHSMVFSCLYHTEFFVFPKIGKAQLNRLTSLQSMFEIRGRMLSNNVDLNELICAEAINWNRVDEILNEKREVSNRYLDDALKM